MKKTNKKLSLNKETVRRLSKDELTRAGGAVGTYATCVCQTLAHTNCDTCWCWSFLFSCPETCVQVGTVKN